MAAQHIPEREHIVHKDTLANFPVSPSTVVLAGDWHGNRCRAEEALVETAKYGVNVLVHLGDFGFWTPGSGSRAYLDGIEERCKDLGITLMWVDGNHEDHASLNAIPLSVNGTRYVRPHIIHLPRGFRWTWNGKTWMALGGAHSVDSLIRKLGVNVWEEERLSEDDVTRAVAGGAVDIVAAHDCPNKVYVPYPVSNTFPLSQIALAERHRDVVGDVVDAVRPSILFHGHYHVRHTGERPLPDGGVTKIVGLSDDTGPLYDNITLFDV